MAKKVTTSDERAVWTSGRGIRFQIFPVSSFLATEAEKRNPKPKVPTVWLEEKQREEPNPSHPDYIEAVREWNLDQSLERIRLWCMLGTKLDFVPDEIERPEDTGWSDTLKIVGFDVPADGIERYYAWLKYYALPNQTDLFELTKQVQLASGLIKEEEVQEAMASFPDIQERDSNNGVSPTS